MKKQLTMVLPCAILLGCGTAGSKSEAELLNQKQDTAQAVSVSREILDDMMHTLPAPIEMANLITKSKGGFDKELLIPAENAEKFADKYSQALALGGYGVDMGYLNLNNKMIYVVEYLESLNTVSKELKVNHFLDFSVLSNLAKNRNNVDSLIEISTKNFNEIDEYLRSQKRGDLSVLILVGSWVEGLHMFANVAKKNPGEEINKRIGEQKVIIDNVYAILGKLQNIEYYKELKDRLDKLKNAYANVKITYEYKEPEMKEVNGELVITDRSETIITITPQDIDKITQEIFELRTALFKTAKHA